jgi:hypothetical protein
MQLERWIAAFSISSSDYCKFATDHCTEVTTLIGDILFSGCSQCSGGRGQHASYRQLGIVTVGGSRLKAYVKQKKNCKMLWQTRPVLRQALMLPFMHHSLLPTH